QQGALGGIHVLREREAFVIADQHRPGVIADHRADAYRALHSGRTGDPRRVARVVEMQRDVDGSARGHGFAQGVGGGNEFQNREKETRIEARGEREAISEKESRGSGLTEPRHAFVDKIELNQALAVRVRLWKTDL